MHLSPDDAVAAAADEWVIEPRGRSWLAQLREVWLSRSTTVDGPAAGTSS